jgi:hypothetical protein
MRIKLRRRVKVKVKVSERNTSREDIHKPSSTPSTKPANELVVIRVGPLKGRLARVKERRFGRLYLVLEGVGEDVRKSVKTSKFLKQQKQLATSGFSKPMLFLPGEVEKAPGNENQAHRKKKAL